MQSIKYRKHVAIVMCSEMGNQIYPLTKSFPISNLPVGNKKLIVYQLQQLEAITDIDSIVIVYSKDSVKTKKFLKEEFMIFYPQYPHHIEFFRVQNNQAEYLSLQQLFASSLCGGFDTVQGVIIIPPDLISSTKFATVLQEHSIKKADVTMLLKEKKQFGKDEKQLDFDMQPLVDIVLIGQTGQVFALKDIENYQYSGFNLPAWVYRRISKASLLKVVDSRLYILNQRAIKIVKNLISSQLTFIKTDFIDTLIRNQTNSTLLDLISQKSNKPLKIVARLAAQNDYIRRINSLKLYQTMCMDSLIRGAKQKEVLLPTTYTPSLDQKLMQDFKGSLIGKGCLIEHPNKMNRNVIQNGCKIGKNIQINNSIIMSGTVIEDGCKISSCTIGPNCIIRSNSILTFCQLAAGRVVDSGSNNEKQMLIPLDQKEDLGDDCLSD